MKSLETFDYLAIPTLNKKLVLELARCEWIARRENVLCLGNSGTGKTHIALALGLAACQRGLRVRFTTAAALVNELMEGARRKTAAALPEAPPAAGAADRRRTGIRAAHQSRGGNAV